MDSEKPKKIKKQVHFDQVDAKKARKSIMLIGSIEPPEAPVTTHVAAPAPSVAAPPPRGAFFRVEGGNPDF